MSDALASAFAARATKRTLPIHAIPAKRVGAFLARGEARWRRWAEGLAFRPKPGRHLLVPAADGAPEAVILALSEAPSPWDTAALPRALPKGRYAFAGEHDDARTESLVLGWALGAYEFTRYRSPRYGGRALVLPKGPGRARALRLAEATYWVRDLVTTPAEDLGPAELEEAARTIAKPHGARVTAIRGDDLLTKKYPAVHAVGRAATRAPRLVDLRWGKPQHPKITLVGKGVVFDSGGLDLKPASGMLLMKKDMGGAAHVLGLAHAIMDAKLKVRLRVLVPAVENAVAGNAFRPLDVLSTRKGITVEVGNTDAEGRLILCDALAEAVREEPELLIDFATLTGAARVALGTEVPALFSNRDELAAELLDAGTRETDPLWRMPLIESYERHLESRVADVSNVGGGRYGGAITAALFLRRFVGAGTPWAHVDLNAYNMDTRPGRPKGGEAMGLRALYGALETRYG
ncbi:MAG: leucyl aminopeptidase family protein [Myxococcota bacterium]